LNQDNICFFALFPEDEVSSAARNIRAQDKLSPLFLLPGSEISERVARAFADEWQKQGGDAVPEQHFGSLATLKASVNSGITLVGAPVSVSRKGRKAIAGVGWMRCISSPHRKKWDISSQ